MKLLGAYRAVGVLTVVLTVALATFGDERPDPLADLKDRERRVREVVERVTAATVVDGWGTGSGVVVSKDGYVLTAAHNFQLYPNEKTVPVVFPGGRTVTARRLGYDQTLDAGLLKITDEGEWPYVALGDSAAVKRGDWCVALGHPGGYSSRRPRPQVRVGRVQHANGCRLLTDCAVYSGDSGGPLFDLSGRLIGIHSAIHEYVPYGRHVPAAAFKTDWDRLARGDRWGTGMFGSYAEACRPLFGAALEEKVSDRPEVRSVATGSSADAAGLKAGDAVTSFDGETLSHREHLLDLLDDRQPGDRVRLTVRREGRDVELVATLRPQDLSSPEPRPAIPRHPWTEADTRARRVRVYERQSPECLAALRPVAAACRASTVSVKVGGKVVALGTVIDTDGGVLTKASELKGAAAPACGFSDGSERPAKVAAVDDEYDLALLTTSGPKTTPVRWAEDVPAAGTTVVTADPAGTPLASGVVSGSPWSRAVAPYWPVRIDPDPQGVALSRWGPLGPAAERAGLTGGDVIVALDGRKVTTPVSLLDAVNRQEPGAKVRVEYLREGQRRSTEIVLGRSDRPPAWFRDEMIRLGAVPSARNYGFPSVFAHDTPLLPEQCGGPLVGLDGRAVGVNIARFGRVESFAIPPDRVTERVNRMRAGLEKGWCD
jgi:serine protease Do